MSMCTDANKVAPWDRYVWGYSGVVAGLPIRRRVQGEAWLSASSAGFYYFSSLSLSCGGSVGMLLVLMKCTRSAMFVLGAPVLSWMWWMCMAWLSALYYVLWHFWWRGDHATKADLWSV